MVEPLTLFVEPGSESFDVKTIRMALRIKTLDFAEQPRRPGDPRLTHGTFALNGSLPILEYLAESFPFPGHPRLFPADLRERAICRELMMALRGSQADRDAAIERAGRLQTREVLFAERSIVDFELAIEVNRRAAAGEPVPNALLSAGSD